jgi:hypothetical protein
VTKPFSTVEEAFRLRDEGRNLLQISRALGVNRSALRDWFQHPLEHFAARAEHEAHSEAGCPLIARVACPEYAYLLGQYLGDGTISPLGPRGVLKLRIFTCDDYPEIRQRCVDSIRVVLPNHAVGFVQGEGCGEVSAYSKHWRCLFPQHGPGRKHERLIELAPWQRDIVETFPREFLTGLIDSDGCRCINNVVVRGKPYSYPRYFFSNVSNDILMLCAWAFDLVGVEWRQNNWNSLSVAKKDSVALLDTFIGPKS